jgi:hypothetical protein
MLCIVGLVMERDRVFNKDLEMKPSICRVFQRISSLSNQCKKMNVL